MAADITIETSTDTVEEVTEALGGTVEIEESQEETPETPEPEAPAPEAEAEEEPEAEVAGEEEPEEEPTPKKPAPATVPRARLNEEIKKRKLAEQRLADAQSKPPAPTPAAEAPEESRPETFSGKPEPQIEEFTKDVDVYDPVAMNKATVAWAKAHSAWDREEARAEMSYDEQQRQARDAAEAHTKHFREILPKTIERHPDYHEIVSKSKVDISEVMKDFIYESEYGPDILVHLALNPEDNDLVLQSRTYRGQVRAMEELEARVAEEIGVAPEAETPKPKAATPPTPKPKTVSKTPPPPTRLRPAGPGPKTLQELAGPTDRTGIDIEFNPEFERADKERHRT